MNKNPGITVRALEARLKTLAYEEAFLLTETLRDDPRKGIQGAINRWRKAQNKHQAEYDRLEALAQKEESLMRQGFRYVAGLDEAGRGPLAGPVMAAAVVLPLGFRLPGLNDSKQLSAGTRAKLAWRIKGEALAWAIGQESVEEIEAVNILEASKWAMQRALSALPIEPDYLLLDAVTLPGIRRQEGIIRGDALCACISAASILAKTSRDQYMEALDQAFPHYGFSKNKGYGTRAHIEAIGRYGPCPAHRMSFLGGIMGAP